MKVNKNNTNADVFIIQFNNLCRSAREVLITYDGNSCSTMIKYFDQCTTLLSNLLHMRTVGPGREVTDFEVVGRSVENASPLTPEKSAVGIPRSFLLAASLLSHFVY